MQPRTKEKMRFFRTLRKKGKYTERIWNVAWRNVDLLNKRTDIITSNKFQRKLMVERNLREATRKRKRICIFYVVNRNVCWQHREERKIEIEKMKEAIYNDDRFESRQAYKLRGDVDSVAVLEQRRLCVLLVCMQSIKTIIFQQLFGEYFNILTLETSLLN